MKAIVSWTHEELSRLLTVALDNDYNFYVLLLVSVTHGLRVSEAINLRRKDFSTADGLIYLTVQRLKGSLKTHQKLVTSSNPLLDEQTVVSTFPAGMRPDDLLFHENGEKIKRFHINYLVRQYGKLADIPAHKRFPHAAKHTCGMLMRRAGAPIEVLQEALGHANINNTRIYLHVPQEEVDAARSNAFAAATVAKMSR
jgi:integrase/recombinase XerD